MRDRLVEGDLRREGGLCEIYCELCGRLNEGEIDFRRVVMDYESGVFESAGFLLVMTITLGLCAVLDTSD